MTRPAVMSWVEDVVEGAPETPVRRTDLGVPYSGADDMRPPEYGVTPMHQIARALTVPVAVRNPGKPVLVLAEASR